MPLAFSLFNPNGIAANISPIDLKTICYDKSSEKWLDFYNNFKNKIGYYPSSLAEDRLEKMFLNMSRLEKQLREEKSSIIKEDGYFKVLIGMPFDYIGKKSAQEVRKKYKTLK